MNDDYTFCCGCGGPSEHGMFLCHWCQDDKDEEDARRERFEAAEEVK